MRQPRNLLVLISALALLVTGSASALAGAPGSFGLRGGVGTDVTGGLAYGIGGNYLLEAGTNALELGVLLFGGSFEETTDEGNNTYEETTDVFVFALTANYLVGYELEQKGPFFVVGFGLGSFSVEWEERSATDSSLGPLLPGGGSMQSDDGTAAGTIFNLGAGQNFGNGFDLRFEIPVFLTFSAPGEASSVVPTFVLTAGMHF